MLDANGNYCYAAALGCDNVCDSNLVLDCNGTCNGPLRVDKCSVCGGDDSTCTKDSAITTKSIVVVGSIAAVAVAAVAATSALGVGGATAAGAAAGAPAISNAFAGTGTGQAPLRTSARMGAMPVGTAVPTRRKRVNGAYYNALPTSTDEMIEMEMNDMTFGNQGTSYATNGADLP